MEKSWKNVASQGRARGTKEKTDMGMKEDEGGWRKKTEEENDNDDKDDGGHDDDDEIDDDDGDRQDDDDVNKVSARLLEKRDETRLDYARLY